MKSPATWQGVLTAPAPAPGRHIAQLCTEPRFLARAAGRFASDGLRRGEAVILVATPPHWHAIARHLEDERFALNHLQRRGQLTVLDAAQCLGGCLVDGMPDRARFRALIGGAVDAVKAAGHRSVRAFGEMVDLLHRTSLAAMIRLEELWGELVTRQGISLLCGYSLDNFDPQIHRGLLQRVCTMHCELVPVEDSARLERAVERAYAEVFGPGGDTSFLRSVLLAHYARPAAMPDAQAAILAVRELDPKTADALLDRVRHHYRAMTVPQPPD